ncbi:MAG: hypothetical protein WC655_14135, partial [Candidatus Hydrogenedentales bacterium]
MIPTILLCHIRGIEDLAASLLKRAEVRFVTLHQPGSVLLERAGIPHTPFDALVTDAMMRNALDQAQPRLKLLVDALRNAPAYWPHPNIATWKVLAPRMLGVLQRDLIEQMVVVDVMKRIASEHAFKLVISPEDVTRDTRTAVLAARSLGIPSLHILHGVNSGAIAVHASVVADRLAVYSEHTRAHYVANGVSPDRIAVTGNPAWDVFAQPPGPEHKTRFCTYLDLDPSHPILVYAMTSVPALSAACIARQGFPVRITEAAIQAFASLATR